MDDVNNLSSCGFVEKQLTNKKIDVVFIQNNDTCDDHYLLRIVAILYVWTSKYIHQKCVEYLFLTILFHSCQIEFIYKRMYNLI